MSQRDKATKEVVGVEVGVGGWTKLLKKKRGVGNIGVFMKYRVRKPLPTMLCCTE